MVWEERILNKIDDLDQKVDNLTLEFVSLKASLPSAYVPRKEINEAKHEAAQAKRWAVSSGFGFLLTVAGLVLNIVGVI